MNRNASAQWAREYQEFLAAEPVSPPEALSESIISRVRRDLNPSAWLVFSKLTLVHVFVGTVTLLFCPQFGFSPSGGMGLMALFMKFGEEACMLGCGAVFMSGSALMAAIVLRPEQVRVIRKTRFLQISSLALLSMAVFVCAGAGLLISMGLFWVLGSVLGGLVSLEIGWALRFRVASALKRMSGLN